MKITLTKLEAEAVMWQWPAEERDDSDVIAECGQAQAAFYQRRMDEMKLDGTALHLPDDAELSNGYDPVFDLLDWLDHADASDIFAETADDERHAKRLEKAARGAAKKIREAYRTAGA